MGAASDLIFNYQHVIEELTLTTGANGVFAVRVDDKLVYSKDQTGRHAEGGEVLRLVREILGPDIPIYGT